MEAFIVSAGLVALAEVGDKTQLLSLVLAARFRRPWPVVLGILVATLANHAAAAALGSWITQLLGPHTLRWIVGLSFIGMAAWTLKPDTLADDEVPRKPRFGVFGTTLVAFFVAEMGDKTQIATVALAARFDALLPVLAGSTLGMMCANVPVVVMGERLTRRLPVRLVQVTASVLFLALGLAALFLYTV